MRYHPLMHALYIFVCLFLECFIVTYHLSVFIWIAFTHTAAHSDNSQAAINEQTTGVRQ